MQPTWRGKDGGTGNAQASGQSELKDRVDLNPVEGNVGFGLEDVHIKSVEILVVDAFNADLVVYVMDIDLVLGQVRVEPVTECAGSLVGDVANDRRHLSVNTIRSGYSI